LEVSQKDLFADMEKWFGVPLEQIDRLLFFLPGVERELVRLKPFLDSLGKQGQLPNLNDEALNLLYPVAVVRTLAPFDRKKVSERVVPGGVEKMHNGKPLVTTGPKGDALHFIGDRLYVRGPTPVVEAFLDLPARTESGPARKVLNPNERKVGVLFVNTGFYVPLLADVLSRHAGELPEILREVRKDKGFEAFVGKEFLDSLEKDLAERAQREPDKLVLSVVEHVFDRVAKERPEFAQFRPFFSTRSLVVDTDLSGVWQLDARLTFNNDKQAMAAREVIKSGRGPVRAFAQQMRDAFAQQAKDPRGRVELVKSLQKEASGNPLEVKSPEQLVKVFDWLGEMLDRELTIGGEGNTAQIGFRTRGENFVSSMGLGAGALTLAAQRVKESALASMSQNNLKLLALALHNYNDANGQFPRHAIFDRAGKPLLSWRVAILPFILEDALYKEFHLDEAWDSPHNIKLLDRMPKVYASPREKTPGNQTYYQLFVGPGAVFESGASSYPRLAGITDGTSNTVLVVEAGEPVPWSKPDDVPFDPKKPLPKLGGRKFRDGFHAALADGSVHFIKYGISEKTLKAAITANGGEVLAEDW
jgi:hypothetical protein